MEGGESHHNYLHLELDRTSLMKKDENRGARIGEEGGEDGGSVKKVGRGKKAMSDDESNDSSDHSDSDSSESDTPPPLTNPKKKVVEKANKPKTMGSGSGSGYFPDGNVMKASVSQLKTFCRDKRIKPAGYCEKRDFQEGVLRYIGDLRKELVANGVVED